MRKGYKYIVTGLVISMIGSALYFLFRGKEKSNIEK